MVRNATYLARDVGWNLCSTGPSGTPTHGTVRADHAFDERRVYGTGRDATRGVALADVDGDGHLDILNANIGQPNAVYFGDGSGGFARSRSLNET